MTKYLFHSVDNVLSRYPARNPCWIRVGDSFVIGRKDMHKQCKEEIPNTTTDTLLDPWYREVKPILQDVTQDDKILCWFFFVSVSGYVINCFVIND